MNERGILLFAHNNAQIDYAKLATCSALMAKKHLQVPVCLVTDSNTYKHLREHSESAIITKAFDIILENDSEANEVEIKQYRDGHWTIHEAKWLNQDRINAYELSPFHETLVMDVDYLTMDNSLQHVWGHEYNFLCNKTAIRIDRKPVPLSEQFVSPKGPAMYWATLMFFRKSSEAQNIFSLMNFIKSEYNYYRYICQLPGNIYRNDFSLSLALHILNGFLPTTIDYSLPAPEILTAWSLDEIFQVNEPDSIIFMSSDEVDQSKYRLINIKKTSVHVFNKFSILRHADKLIELHQ
jgi:hypothetical protein